MRDQVQNMPPEWHPQGSNTFVLCSPPTAQPLHSHHVTTSSWSLSQSADPAPGHWYNGQHLSNVVTATL